jgi:hypothetical protein
MFDMIRLETMQRKAPSIFADRAAERTSSKYQHISTARVVEGLLDEGFLPTWVAQCNARTASKRAHTKHILRFRHIDARPTSSGLYPEIVLINSHDGLSSYRLMAGIFRMVCSNGLIAGTSINDIRVRHQGDIVSDVIEGTYKVIEDSKMMIESADKMSSLMLSKHEKNIFSVAAHTIRFDDKALGEVIDPSKLLSPRRTEELNKNDLGVL